MNIWIYKNLGGWNVCLLCSRVCEEYDVFWVWGYGYNEVIFIVWWR